MQPAAHNLSLRAIFGNVDRLIRQSMSPVWRFLLLAVGYFVMARLGLCLAPPELAISLIWLPTGIAVAGLFRWGLRYWPAVLLATAVLVQISFDVRGLPAVVIVTGQTLAPVITTALLRRMKFHADFDRRRDIGLFCAGTLAGMFVSATCGAFSLAAAGLSPWAESARAWLTWWLGDSMGVLIAGPLLLSMTWRSWGYVRQRGREFAAWCAVAAVMFVVIFFTPAQPGVGTLPLVFLPLALTAWAALRFGVTGTSFAVLALALIAAAGTAAGCGPFLKPDQYSGVFLLWAYLGSVAVLSFMVMGIEIGRDDAKNALVRSKQDLENANRELEAAVENSRHLAREASAANKAKGDFLARTSHEIRNPMNGIIGMMDLLRSSELTDTQREYVDVARSSGEALLRLIDELLDLSKIEAGKLELDPVDFCVRDLIDDICVLYRPQAQKKGIELSVGIAADVPSCQHGDALRLRQILINLLANAMKFTEVGGVRIAVTRELGTADMLRFEVIDSGPGIPADRLAALFQPFVQAGRSDARNYGGTGLGLAISRELVELMGGQIGARSEPGQGSRFWFTARFAACSAEVPKASGESLSTPSARAGGRALVVDDSASNQKVARLQLQRLGFEADTVSDGRAAIEALASADYDLVLMDCEMPGLDGHETTRLIRAGNSRVRNRDVKIIALTGHAMPGDEEKCLASGMNAYLTKPIRLDALAAAVARWRAQA